jgi:hypothetical protein
VNPPGIPWTPGEAASVNEFLNSPVGKKWLGVLLSRKPRLDMTNAERAGLSGAYIAGFEQVFNEMAATRIALRDKESASRPGIDPAKD